MTRRGLRRRIRDSSRYNDRVVQKQISRINQFEDKRDPGVTAVLHTAACLARFLPAMEVSNMHVLRDLSNRITSFETICQALDTNLFSEEAAYAYRDTYHRGRKSSHTVVTDEHEHRRAGREDVPSGLDYNPGPQGKATESDQGNQHHKQVSGISPTKSNNFGSIKFTSTNSRENRSTGQDNAKRRKTRHSK
jgi:hypothetical protein